ncbi:hypothetical protein [Flavobacterium sandaracinum]|uniref:Uncharacterized protein n=1 Tax=Flavobacterium sandaracinum TaxID=2541733 RepID=A0A4R5CYJ3_9FLAO|nr:hypothetical protein [Flavobacterium sandaracinum]TDE03035.1 hypothetical protein E0F91_11700 [Flavobacterium sandaracinum]
MNNQLQNIYQSYELLLPSKEDGMVIFLLHQKIKDREIEEPFSYGDFRQVVKEVADWSPGGIPRSETLLKNFLNNFIERPADQKNGYKLTEYALKFIAIVDHKLNNPYRTFPLRKSFEKYTTFQATEIQDIVELERWFEQGFNNITRQNIIDHLEALKDVVSQSVKELGQILQQENIDIVQIVSEFAEIFTGLNEKTEEIRDTLRLGNRLERELQLVVDHFYAILDTSSNTEPKSDATLYKKVSKDYESAQKIQWEVNTFFMVVGGKIGQLREKIVFASNKLNDLQHNFHYQSSYKLNIKRMLHFVLTESRFTKDGPGLSACFPRKSIPYESFKITMVNHMEEFFPKKVMVTTTLIDKEYQESENAKIEKDIARQERIMELVSYYKELLALDKQMDFTEKFYHILEQDKDVEIALNVSYELLLFAHHSKQYKVTIDQNLLKNSKDKKIYSWQTDIVKR